MIYGVGYIGDIDKCVKSSDLYRRIYRTWSNMLRRCYSASYHMTRPTYKECTVEDYWKVFSNFLESFKALPGYAEWLKTPYMSLDKDTLIEGNKMYSRATCVLISHVDNSKAVWYGNAKLEYICHCGNHMSRTSSNCIECSSKITRKGVGKPSERKVERPLKEQLLVLIKTKPILQIGKQYGVSDNSIRKWCKFYDLPYRKKDIKLLK